MASEISIANRALIKVGADTLTSLSDDNKAARTVSALYADIRDEVLRAFPWNFAIARSTELAESVLPPSFGYSRRFALPADCLRVLGTDQAVEDYRVEGRSIVCSSGTLKIRYIRREEDPNLYDAEFTEVFAARLAAELAVPIVNSTTLLDAMHSLYRRKLDEARGTDSQEGTPGDMVSGSWINARE